MLFRVRIVLTLLLLFASQVAGATTATGNLPVTATVISICVIGTVTPVAFGNYDPTSATANNTGVGSIPVTCTSGTSYTIGLNAGTFTGASVTSRKMTISTATGPGLAYSLFQNSARTTNWGNTPGTDTPGALLGSAVAQTVNVYGQIPPSQAIPAGSYSDTVTITVTY